MTVPRNILPTQSSSTILTGRDSRASGETDSTSIPAVPRRREADYSTVAWALTGVTCFVLAVGIFVIRQVIETPQRGGPAIEVPLTEESSDSEKIASTLLVLRPEKPSVDKADESLPRMR